MSLALFFGVLVLLLVLTVPICVSFAFVTLLPSIVDASFPYTADAAVRSMVSGLNNFPPACDSPVYHRWRDHGEGADF